MGKYGDQYFQHLFCVDPRPDYKIIFGNDLARGLGAIHDHAEGKVTFKTIPGRKTHLRLPLIPASRMKKARSYQCHEAAQKSSPLMAAIQQGMDERAEHLLGADVVEYLGEELVEIAMLQTMHYDGGAAIPEQEQP